MFLKNRWTSECHPSAAPTLGSLQEYLVEVFARALDVARGPASIERALESPLEEPDALMKRFLLEMA